MGRSPDIVRTQPDGPGRWLITGLATAGCIIMSYLALYQWEFISTVWDPFFGDGSEVVLLSQTRIPPREGTPQFPVSAILALGYAVIVALSALRRAATPRARQVIDVFTSLVIIVVAIAHMILLLSQPTVFFDWCTLCLASIAISAVILALALPVVGRSARYLEARWRTRG